MNDGVDETGGIGGATGAWTAALALGPLELRGGGRGGSGSGGGGAPPGWLCSRPASARVELWLAAERWGLARPCLLSAEMVSLHGDATRDVRLVGSREKANQCLRSVQVEEVGDLLRSTRIHDAAQSGVRPRSH